MPTSHDSRALVRQGLEQKELDDCRCLWRTITGKLEDGIRMGWRNMCKQASPSDTSLSTHLRLSKWTCPLPLPPSSFHRQSWCGTRGDSALHNDPTPRLLLQISRLPPLTAFSSHQRRSSVRYRQHLMHCQKIVRMAGKVRA